jgi:disulfide bond formation protein DsbB
MTRERLREAGVPILVFLLGLATIAGAWTAQLAFGLRPCALCLQQRWPYYIGLPIVALAIGAALYGAPSRWVRLIMAVSGLAWGISVYLGVNHAGVEWGWWPGPSDCGTTGGIGGISTIKDLQAQLQGIQIVSCTQAAWRFLGLSFAGWNAVVSIILTAGAAYAAAGGFSSEPITIVRKTPRVSPQA